MGNLSPHFDDFEFACDCGKITTMSPELISRLESLYNIIGAGAIIITSGYRCPDCSVKAGGSHDDAHTRSLAADIMVLKNTKDVNYFDSDDIAEAAERVGFTGIGIIDRLAVHVDVRTPQNYKNGHWFGDERTGNDNISTFQRGTIFNSHTENVSRETSKHTIKIIFDDKVIYEKEIET